SQKVQRRVQDYVVPFLEELPMFLALTFGGWPVYLAIRVLFVLAHFLQDLRAPPGEKLGFWRSIAVPLIFSLISLPIYLFVDAPTGQFALVTLTHMASNISATLRRRILALTASIVAALTFWNAAPAGAEPPRFAVNEDGRLTVEVVDKWQTDNRSTLTWIAGQILTAQGAAEPSETEIQELIERIREANPSFVDANIIFQGTIQIPGEYPDDTIRVLTGASRISDATTTTTSPATPQTSSPGTTTTTTLTERAGGSRPDPIWRRIGIPAIVFGVLSLPVLYLLSRLRRGSGASARSSGDGAGSLTQQGQDREERLLIRRRELLRDIQVMH
ncbi:MAG: hypothetical protein ACT4O3_06330, partial [Elusimicrobiota bacterium]